MNNIHKQLLLIIKKSEQTERKRIGDFWQKKKDNSKYKPFEILNLPENNEQSRAYTIQIKDLDKIPYNIAQSNKSQPIEKLLLKIRIHLFYKKEKEVFSYTYISQGLDLIETSQYNYKLSERSRPSIYFHTNTKPADQIFAIFDFEIKEMQAQEIPLNEKHIGIAELDLSKIGDSELQVRKISFNEYKNSPDISKAQDLGVKFTVSIIPSPEFEKAHHLIPMLYLVDNMQHEIEGLELDRNNKHHLPPHPEPVRLRPAHKINIEQVEIHIPDSIEAEIMKSAQQNLMVTNVSGASADAANSYKNIERQGYKLSCCYHNNRTTVNRGGAQNKLILNDAGRIDRQEDEDKKITYRVLKYEGSTEIDNVFASATSMLVLQLEFKVILSIAQNKVDKDFIIGYLPIYVSDRFGLQDYKENNVIKQIVNKIKLQDTLMVGGGKSIDLKGMMKFQTKFPIYVLAKINLSNAFGGLSPRESVISDKPSSRRLPKTFSHHSLQNTQQQFQQEELSEPQNREQSDELLKGKAKLEQIQREIDQRQKESEALSNQQSHQKIGQGGQAGLGGQGQQGVGPAPHAQQRGNMGNQHHPPSNSREYSDIVHQYESKVNELQKTIQQLRQDNEETKLQSQKEFQEIKELLSGIQKPRTNYNTFQDPFATGRSQNEVVIVNEDEKKRYEILETLTTVPKMRSNFKNQQAFTLKPASGAEELPNIDRNYLRNKGVQGILDDTFQTGNEAFIEESDLINEYHDVYQASLFAIKVVAFKAEIRNFEEHDQLKKDSIFSENYYVPQNMYFTFNFFEYEEFKTESYSYQDAGQIHTMKKLLTENKPLVLQTTSYLYNKIGDQQKSYNFNIDPSQFYPEVHKNFVNYLFQKSLHLDIWDADNLMLYGTVKIPLKSLLRRQKQSVEKQISVPIIDNDFSRERGRLIVFLTNKGFQPQRQEFVNTQQFNRTGGLQNSFGSGGFNQSQKFNQTGMSNVSNLHSTGHKKKIRSTEPLSYDQAKSANNAQQNMKAEYNFSNDPEQRQKERVRRFKVKALLKEKGEDADVEKFINKQSEQYRQINDIQVLKEMKKESYIKNVLSALLTQEIILDAQFGTTKYHEQEITNNGNEPATYQIRIDDPDGPYLGFSELTPITQPEEWRFLMQRDDNQGQKDVQFIDKEKMNFVLDKGQSITIIFKFISFREIDPTIDSHTNLEEYLRGKPVEYRQQYINQRVIDVSITNQSSHNENQGFKLCVRPHRQVIDHVFRYYERGNKQVQLILPALYSFGHPPTEKPSLYCTDLTVQFEWIGDNEISLHMRVPNVLRVTRFYLLAYRDTFFRDLLAIWEIEVNSLEGIDIKIDMGQFKKSNLTLNSDSMRLVKFHSSHPLSALFEKPFDQPYTVSKGKVNIIGLTMRSFSMMRQRVQINCVDQSTKELLYSWMVRIETEKPVVSKIYDLKIPVNKESHIQKFSFQNRTQTENTFVVESSQIELLDIVDRKMFLGIGEKTQIRIRIPKQEQPGIGEVFVFVTNPDEKMECILFKLHFTVNR